MPILSTVADNLLFLNQWKREINFLQKNVPLARVYLGTTCIRSGHATDRATMPGMYNLSALTLMLAHCMVAVRAEPAVTCNLAAEAA